jgi:hypothetical protein
MIGTEAILLRNEENPQQVREEFMSRSIRRTLAACALAGIGSIAVTAAAQPVEQQSCQRDCLEGYVNKYLEAMRDNDVDPNLFSRNARFTENGVELPLGNEGLWFDTSALGHYKFYIPDVETQQIAFLGTVMAQAPNRSTGPAQPAEPVGLALRLRIDRDGKISEIEQIAARPDRPLTPGAQSTSAFPATGAAVDAMGSPDPVFLERIPQNERMSRSDLIRSANYYFDGLQRNTGEGYYPFTDDCLRHENGIITAGPKGTAAGRLGPLMTCKEQFEKGLKGVVTGIRDRRFVAVDRERGIVFAFAFFDHRPINWTWELGELFKIDNGQIRRIETIFIRAPYGMNSGWSTYEQTRSEKIQDIR